MAAHRPNYRNSLQWSPEVPREFFSSANQDLHAAVVAVGRPYLDVVQNLKQGQATVSAPADDQGRAPALGPAGATRPAPARV